MIRKILVILMSSAQLFSFSGCNKTEDINNNSKTAITLNDESSVDTSNNLSETESETETFVQTDTNIDTSSEIITETILNETEKLPDETPKNSGYTIVIDPGHQIKGNNNKEPVGPGASETKAKVTGGTRGAASGLSEYELNLQIALKLKNLLVSRGYNVIMTRESNDVDLSNSERAAIANNANADAFVRIHANGSENANTQGAMTICQTPNNPYNSEYYKDSYRLSECILNDLVAETGAVREKIWETDTMSGINWAKVPSTIVEVGYMTNKEEDLRLASDDYQNKVAVGIANGIDKFLN